MQFVMCPSSGASGGILIAWNEAYWQKEDEFVGRYSVSVLFKDARHNTEWVASSIYGPTNIDDEADFWAELSHVAGIWNCPWILGGDFNVIRFPNEKEVVL